MSFELLTFQYKYSIVLIKNKNNVSDFLNVNILLN